MIEYVGFMALRLYNTRTRRKERFIPLKSNLVRMYICGLTVYDFAHIGHARTYVFWDVVKRYLNHLGYQVVSVINYTDVDDKIIDRSNSTRIPWDQLAEYFIDAFDRDMEALNVQRYTVQCRATDHILEMVRLAEKLEKKGYVYRVDDDLFFEIAKFPRYGELSRRTPEELLDGARVEVDERKRAAGDFAVWKSAKEGEPSWDSPWGRGRPGWHIECSTMAIHYLGERIDIHGGAIDNLFPHHENEVAQSESVTRKRFVKYWMHPEHLLMDHKKMSKSLGNFITVRELLRDYDPRAIRLAFYTTHYRVQLSFSDDTMTQAVSSLERILNFQRLLEAKMRELGIKERAASETASLFSAESKNLKERSSSNGSRQSLEEKRLERSVEKFRKGFHRAMDDDINIPRALAAVFDLIRSGYRYGLEDLVDPELLRKIHKEYREHLDILGIRLDLPSLSEEEATEDLLNLISSVREDLRKEGQYALADKIRSDLSAAGYDMEDTPGGVRIKKRSG